MMKNAAPCNLFLIVGVVLAGCGSAHAVITFKAPTKLTLASAETGARIACQRGPGPSATSPVVPNGRLIVGAVPAPGKTSGGINGLSGEGISLYLARRADGSLAVNCS